MTTKGDTRNCHRFINENHRLTIAIIAVENKYIQMIQKIIIWLALWGGGGNRKKHGFTETRTKNEKSSFENILHKDIQHTFLEAGTALKCCMGPYLYKKLLKTEGQITRKKS